MGIYIKGMGMPKCCDECELQRENNYEMTDFCIITGKETLCEKGRRKDCPLIEVKTPHGRLIDADALVTWDDGYGQRCTPIETIDDAPTVIKAEVK